MLRLIFRKSDNFTDSEWQNLYKLSENTFVEESESLKQGGSRSRSYR